MTASAVPNHVRYGDLPQYLKIAFAPSAQDEAAETFHENPHPFPVLDLDEIRQISDTNVRLVNLWLRRHVLTEALVDHGKCYPPLIFERAQTYEALEYEDLAAADSFVVYTICLQVLTDERVTDIVPYDLDGREAWSPGREIALQLIVQSLAMLCRSLTALGCTIDAEDKLAELRERLDELSKAEISASSVIEQEHELLEPRGLLWSSTSLAPTSLLSRPSGIGQNRARYGFGRREIYPWNEHEPDRNSDESVKEINELLHRVAPDLEARVTTLPALNDNLESEQLEQEVWHQLGLFAARDLPAGKEVLIEKSIVTAIRPLDDALCDACGQNLEDVPIEDRRECPGGDCDITFCGDDCAQKAIKGYHKPEMEDEEYGSEESETEADDGEERDSTIAAGQVVAPFCGNRSLHLIGRHSTSGTPEWDLYFLLLTRTIAISITQDIHPLDLPEIKFLWGDFITSTPATSAEAGKSPTRTLPFSVQHNLILPLDYFSTLFLTCPRYMPYSRQWMRLFDPWVLNILYAKFRGVANALESTYDGKPELASVHPMWCLANHSCSPNVTWSPSGVRRFIVRSRAEIAELGKHGAGFVVAEKNDFDGVKKGEEVFSHYTDIRLPVEARRERLEEVLGGRCRCERCITEVGVIVP